VKRFILLLLIISLTALLAAEEYVIENSPFNIELVRSDPGQTVISYSFGSFFRQAVEIDGEIYYRINLPKEPAVIEKGAPELPYISRSILIPDEALTDIRVISSEYTDLLMEVSPSKGVIYRNQMPDEIPYTFSDIYEKEGFYPGLLAELGEPYILRDFRGQVVRVNPFQYNPVTGILRVHHSITVEINTIGTDTRNVFIRSGDGYARELENIYHNRFINFSATRYTPLEEQGRMIVIAYDSFVNATMPYVNWKNQKGIPTTIYPVSTIGSTATAIKNFIQSEYDQNDGLVFLQIVGDAAQVPTFTVGGGGSDPSYSLLAGNDAYGDIFVGRFSAETIAQVETQVARTIHYEKDIDTTDTWLSNAMGLASNEGPGHGGLYDNQHLDLIRTHLLAYTYTHVDQFYQPSATSTMVTNAINAGRGFANYTGHGSNTSWSTSGFSSSHVNNLTNDYKLPFIVSVACVNGNFTGTTCFAEAWLRATNNSTGAPTGAIAMYASSVNQAWHPPMSGQLEVTNLLVNEQKNTIGGLFFNGSFQMIDDYGTSGADEFKNWHIFGDASLQARSAAPQNMTVSYNSSIPLGVNTLNVSTGVEGALVSLTNSSYDILAYGYTNSAGNVSLIMDNPPVQPTTLNLTVTGYNKVTYTGSVEVLPADGPFIVLNDYSLSGSGDYTPHNNELVGITVTLENIGLDPAANVQALLTTSSAGVTITDSSETFGNIAAAATVTRPNAFQIQISDDIQDQTTLSFSLAITSGTENWSADFSFAVNAPKLEVTNLIVQDPAPGGNNNGMLDPGETVTMIFNIENTGQAASSAGTALLEDDHPLVSITDPVNNIPSILPGSSNNSSYQVTLGSAIDPGTIVNFTKTVSYGEYTTVHNQSLPVGLITIEIGAGTNTNSTSQAAPINIYYRSLRGQAVYTAAEINAAGYQGEGLITDLGFYVTQTPDHSLPDFIIRMKHTTASNASSHDSGPFQTVYTTSSYTPAAGDWDMLELTEPFEWNGVDNILIDTAFDRVPAWTYSGQQRVFDAASGFRYVRSDGSNQTNATTSTTMSYKPQIRLVLVGVTEIPELHPPSNLSATAGNESVNLVWEVPQGARERDRELLGYNVYRDGVPVNPAAVETTEYTDSGLSNGITYEYQVTALYSQGESEPSNTVSATPEGIYLEPPAGLDAVVVDNENVLLNWQPPGTVSWLHWDNGVNSSGIGTGSAAQFKVAARFSATQLAGYGVAEKYLTKVRFFPREVNCVYTINVWTGGSSTDPGTLVVAQEVADPQINSWNLIDLATPVFLDNDQELWIGYHIDTQTGQPPGVDNGPAENGFGNMIYWNNQWTTLLAMGPTLNYNWNIQGFVVDEVSRDSIAQPLPVSFMAPGEESLSFETDLPLILSSDPGFTGNRASRERHTLLGYRIYRNGEMIGNTTAEITSYLDEGLAPGTYEYYATAIYDAGESEPSNTVTAAPEAQTFFWEEDFDPPQTGWSLEGSNWALQSDYLRFYYSPTVTDYDLSAISPEIALPANVGNLNVSQLFDNYSATNEFLEIIVIHSEGETLLWSYDCSNGSFTLADFPFSLVPFAGDTIQLSFRSHGENSWNINWWNIHSLTITSLIDNPVYSVAVSPGSDSGSGYNGTVVEYLMTVTNTGNTADNYSLSVSGNNWSVSFQAAARDYDDVPIRIIDLGDGRVAMQDTPSSLRSEITETGLIQAGSSKQIQVKVAIPAAANGTDTAVVGISSQNDQETNASMTLATTSLGQNPDIPLQPRLIAEWEPMQGVLIRYPLGIPYSLVREFSNDTTVYTIVSSSTVMNEATTNYQNNNVNLANCEFIIASTNSYWTRDYGPWSIVAESGIGVVDFTYNRPRPYDNAIPQVTADYFEIPRYSMPLTHTGGNMMGNGLGTGASTDLVVQENSSLVTSEIDQIMNNYLGIETYHKVPDPTGEYIEHIDTWAKYLAPDKIMIRSVNTGHSQYSQIEAAADYFAGQLSPYGTPYQVFRVYTPNNEPYTNSLILNNKVYVPVTGSGNDAAAIAAYQNALPGYEVAEFLYTGTGGWQSTDALHCRVMGLADQGMLHLSHIPSQQHYSGLDTPIEVVIKAYSGFPLTEAELFVYWSTTPESPFNTAPLTHQSQDIYVGYIPPQAYGDTVYYYLSASDGSGRTETLPSAGSYDPFSIEINEIGSVSSPEIEAVFIENGYINISWEQIPEASGYIVEASSDIEGEFLPVTTGSFIGEDNLIIWKNLVSDSYRFFRVKAFVTPPARERTESGSGRISRE
jgi:agmatine/peptidylarginine deiminase